MFLKQDDSGVEVKMLQEDLNLLGAGLDVDGVFGPLTKAALEKFQGDQDITVDGVFGPETWDKMSEALVGINKETNRQNDPSENFKIATIHGVIYGDAFYFALPIQDSSGDTQQVYFLLDTGAFELMFHKSDADTLKLPNIGEMSISGVGGKQIAYQSMVTFKLGDQEFTNVPCIVDEDPNFSTNLFGLKFILDNHLTIKVRPDTATELAAEKADATYKLEIYKS